MTIYESRERLKHIDIAKGLGMLCVIIGHTIYSQVFMCVVRIIIDISILLCIISLKNVIKKKTMKD